MRAIAQHHGRTPESPSGEELFRAEALAHRAEADSPRGVLRSPRWTTWGFYGLLATLALLVVAASVVTIDRHEYGIAATDGSGAIVALVPASRSAEVSAGDPVDLGQEGAEVVSVGSEVLSPVAVFDRFGIEVAAPSVAVTTSAVTGPEDGAVRILVESDPLIVSLVPGLSNLFGSGDA